ncbi:cyclic GMP-AMP synthase [Megalops cyprinoides]|uniref:cyclic GMP-AMP synthase n=1 Tax=Megalops cyprinoides TaxID=118141 RepID=UPI0018649630|nr:cyclic GMP-AMP synthase [Megalops cyprinoides]
MDRTTPQKRSVTRKGKNAPKASSPTPGTTPVSSRHLALKTSSTSSPELGKEVEEGMKQEEETPTGCSPPGASFGEEASGTEAPTESSPTPTSSPTTAVARRQRQAQAACRSSSMEENIPEVPPTLSRRIKQRAQAVSLCRANQQRAAELVNHLRDKLLDFLKGNTEQPYFRSVIVLNSGSYYEMVKINDPNEFDMMLLLPTPRLMWTELEGYHGLFYKVSLIRRTRSEIQAFLLDDELTISAPRILNEMRRLVKKFISTYRAPEGAGHWTLSRKRPTSPAVTLVLMEEEQVELLSLDIVPALKVSDKQAWPQATQSGLEVEHWLGKKARRELIKQPFYFVPKRPSGRNLSDAAKESWRISFSHIEKEIIKNHGHSRTCCEGPTKKCCRKQCLKLLKFLIERLKTQYPLELEPLCSYHGKTAFLHTLSALGQDSHWAPVHLPVRFMSLLSALEDHACSGVLPHFFIPGYNLFAPPVFPRRALSCLREALGEQKRLGLPLLQPPSPAPPLTLHPDSPPSPLPDTQKTVSKGTIMASVAVLFFFAIFFVL